MTQNSCFHKTHVSRCCINFPHEKTWQILTNLSKEWDVDRNQRVTMHYESLFHEKLMKMCRKTHEPFFMAMKTAITDFHEIIFTSCFHEPWKVYEAMNMDSHGSWKSHILDRYISWPWKGSYSLACISWVMKVLMAHEIPIKAQLKTHESVQLTLAQK